VGRAAKHNWQKLFIEYNQGRFKSVADFARAKGLNPVAVRREFKKFEIASKETLKTEQNETKKRNKTEQKNDTKETTKQKQHAWEKLKKQFLDWPEERLQAYVTQLEVRRDELESVPFEELTPEETKELGRVRRERRAILSDPDPEKICRAHNHDGSPCKNPVERGKEVCWNHGGAHGSGAPKGSKNALKTGEHETIWFDTLDEDEQELLQLIPVDPIEQINDKIRAMSIRERRMMKRIQDLKNGLTEKERRVLQERKTKKEPIQVYDEIKGEIKVVVVSRDELVVTEVEETQFRAIDDIIRLEEALTRVQDKLIKAIDLKHRLIQKGLDSEEHRLRIEKLKADIEKVRGEEGPTEDDGFINALKGDVSEVWSDDNEET
jgi:uncharacterized protein YjcR